MLLPAGQLLEGWLEVCVEIAVRVLLAEPDELADSHKSDSPATNSSLSY